MSLFAPVYYQNFACIAGDCHHSCCIGWEIDIDPHTLARYNKLPPKERKKILAQTVTQKGTTSFRLAKDGRCPFLTEKGLCSLILTHGEGILCNICREHPRFYNEFSARTEVGLGLCCEEAARLILTEPRPFSLVCLAEEDDSISDPFESDFFETREEIFNLLTDRTLPLSARIDELLRRFEINGGMIYANDAHWQTVYRNLERLDPQWDTALNQWVASVEAVPAWEETASEQLIAYFLYRHLADAAIDGQLKERIAFALLSAHVIEGIAAAQDNDLACLIDTARAYSAEVEYNEEAVEHLIGELALSQ